MSRAKRRVRFMFAAFMVMYVLAVTYPGITPFNRIYPLVFGLPFVFFWIVVWIVIGLIVLAIADSVESR